jgi:hypothetical protein
MPRFYLDVFNGNGKTADEEGLELEDQASARRIALDSVRSIIAEEARSGVIDLSGRIEVKDSLANVLVTVHFTEAFELHIPLPQPNGERPE